MQNDVRVITELLPRRLTLSQVFPGGSRFVHSFAPPEARDSACGTASFFSRIGRHLALHPAPSAAATECPTAEKSWPQHYAGPSWPVQCSVWSQRRGCWPMFWPRGRIARVGRTTTFGRVALSSAIDRRPVGMVLTACAIVSAVASCLVVCWRQRRRLPAIRRQPRRNARFCASLAANRPALPVPRSTRLRLRYRRARCVGRARCARRSGA